MESLGQPFAVLPNDEVVPQAVNQGMPAVITYPNSPASIAIKKMAQRIVDEFAGRPSQPESELTANGKQASSGWGLKKLFGG